MNRVVKRLYVDNTRTITFIFSAKSTVVGVETGKHAVLTMSITEALELWNEFVRRGAKEIR
jgi:hypothetical protein